MGNEAAGDLAGWVAGEHARLERAWFGFRRYVGKDVDVFVGDVAARLRRGELPEPSWVRATRFHTTTGLSSGYRMQAVDDLLAELQGRLLVTRGGADLAPGAATMIVRIERVGFRRTRSGGYDFQEVDEFLNRVIEMLLQGYQPSAVPAFTIRRRGYDKHDVDAFSQELRDYRADVL